MLRKIFELNRDEVMGVLRRLHNEVLCDLYSSPNIIRVIKSRRMKWVGHIVSMGDKGCVYKVLVGRPEGMRLLGRRRRRWENNIKNGSSRSRMGDQGLH